MINVNLKKRLFDKISNKRNIKDLHNEFIKYKRIKKKYY